MTKNTFSPLDSVSGFSRENKGSVSISPFRSLSLKTFSVSS